jgi:hypothetical protein
MENCNCLLGDPNHCDACATEQAKYNAECVSSYESYLWFKEEVEGE